MTKKTSLREQQLAASRTNNKDKNKILPFEKKYIILLHALLHSSKEQRLAILRTADRKLIKYICECALNILKGVIVLKTSEFKRLKRYRKILRQLATTDTNQQLKNLWKNKKRIIIQEGGGFLPLILGPLISGLLSIF